MTAPSHPAPDPRGAPGTTVLPHLRVLRERWALVVAGLLVGLVAGGVLATTLPTRFASETTLYTTALVGPGDPDAAYSGTLLEQQKARFYVAMVTGPGIGPEVSTQLAGQVDPATAAEAVSAEAPPDTPIVMLTAEGRSAEQARALADAAGRALIGVAADVEQASAEASGPTVVLRTVQPATEPVPISVPAPVVVVLGLAVGLLVGALAALVRHATDRTVRTRAELAEVIGGPVVEELPVGRGEPGAATTPRTEAFRRLRTTLGLREGGDHGVLAVTAAAPGEGSGGVAVALAVAMSHVGRRVVVVDVDLRHPGLDGWYEPSAPGLAEVLEGDVPLDVVLRPSADGPDVLVPGDAMTADTLARRETGPVLTALRARYDRVVVAVDAVTEVADALSVTALADAALLVVCAGGATRTRVAEAADRVRATGTPLLGAVLEARRSRWRRAARRAARAPEPVGESLSEPGPPAPHPSPRPHPDSRPRPSPRPRTGPQEQSPRAMAEQDHEHRDGEQLAER